VTFLDGGKKVFEHARVRVCCVEKKNKMKHGIMKMACHWEKMLSTITCQIWVTFGSGRNYFLFARQCVLKCTLSTNQVLPLKINTTNKKRSSDGAVDFNEHRKQVCMRSLKRKRFFFSFQHLLIGGI
jgi:hypothetical protein